MRIKGQEVSLSIMRAGQLENDLTDITNFNATLKLSKLQQGFLGETVDRYDEKFDGADIDFELQLHSQDWIDYVVAVISRARRQAPDLLFNVSATMFFPNGQTPVLTFHDIKFGDFPLNVSARGDYVKLKINASTSDVDFQKS